MAFFVGFVFSSAAISFTPKLFFGVISISLVLFGYNTFNAVYDKEIDRINKPYRPLPMEAISKKHALYLSFVFFLLSASLSLLINLTFFMIMCVAIFLAIIYSHPVTHTKKRFLFGTLQANAMYAVLFPLAGWSVMLPSTVPWLIVLFLFVFGMGMALLKDFEDVKGDIEHHIHTVPYVLGHVNGVIFSALLIVTAALLSGVFIMSGGLAPKYSFIYVFAVAALVNLYFLAKDQGKVRSKKAFVNGMVILTLMEVALILLRIA
jgi:4-hydroxybenzoate polyprenyltransferase